MRRIDHYVPGFSKYDAIGTSTVLLRDALRRAGIASDIVAEAIDPRVRHQARPFDRSSPPGAVLVYHASTHSPMASWLAQRAAAGDALVVCYHNITPSSFFARWEPAAARSMRRARDELAGLADAATLGIGVSAYNTAELDELGFRRTTTSPLLVDLDGLGRVGAPRPPGGGGPELLFVGRVAPNKCQHDVVAAFAAYRRAFAPGARLTLVGGATSLRYLRALEQMIDDLDVAGAVRILDGVSDAELAACYSRADAFVCMSEHEGFCVPVLEAMHLGVPVVAFDAAAVPETVGSAGWVLDDKDPLRVACAIDEVVGDAALRRTLVEAGRRRAGEFGLERTTERMVAAVTGAAGW